jgi:DNA repair protein RecN (Recombination protein N)
MLNHLQICDFAIVTHLELDLAPGMSVITGETGAGKSILIDALGLLLGDRADNSIIRAGAERAEISGIFDLSDLAAANAWLAERDLGGTERICYLRRIISRDGRSRAYIDGSAQPLQALKEFAELLVDIHGQHQHQSLMKRDLQRQLLDDYAGNQALLMELGGHYQDWNRQRQTLAALRQASAEREARLDSLRYQVRELETLNYQPGEIAELQTEHLRLANAGRLLEICQRAVNRLYENEKISVHGVLSQTLQELQSLYELDAALGQTGELLNAALIQITEACAELRHYQRHLEVDPGKLAAVEQRLATLHELVRKHRLSPEELPALLERLRTELEEIENSELRHGQLERQHEETFYAYCRCAE